MHVCSQTPLPLYLRGSKSPQSTFPFTVGMLGLATTVGCIKPLLYPGGGFDGVRVVVCEGGGLAEVCADGGGENV